MLIEALGNIVQTGSMLAFIGSMVTLVVNLKINKRTNKVSSRTYLHTTVENTNLLLADFHFEDRAKLIFTDEYRNFVRGLNGLENADKIKSKTPCSFLKIGNLGSNPCFDVKIRLTLEEWNKELIHKSYNVYVLQEGEDIFIPLVTFNREKYTLVFSEIEFKTLANETLIYQIRPVQEANGRVNITQGMYVKRMIKNKKIFQLNAPDLEWRKLK
ncbi:hypothetical protein [Bacillus thuringiensis]|uniref:hypothetical protein n=1 Tax=Bacillus thuringiensis TaxID=1428 RepID=UPI000BF8C865|nr:hypothetical protein [Bacillus thuringiensis]PFL02886.1 hypothetical protein COJ28_27380 [Bacillus thuringiensis]PGU37783.1 hypothetical protein COD63_27340 [Bacillus thuringiensis]